MSNLKYRPDIDGLRAVAVLGVIVYHAFPKFLPGGFTGVDIFFVISGYLILGILYKGFSEGTFTFRDFYSRRVRRLFPALITLLVICLLYGRLLLLPDEFRRLGGQVAAGTLFIQNFVFWKESGYFDISAALKPLLHLWSLAVEEQFYLLFPPIMILVWKRKWPYAPLMAALLAASFILNLVMSFQDPVPDFFLTPYRAWEFLGGALLAWHHFGKGHDASRNGGWMAVAGVLLLILGMTLLRGTQAYPGWRALLPVSGTLLLIAAGPANRFNRLVLSHPAVVWIGLASYPLYLFHWPLLSFVHIVRGERPPVVETVAALAVAFCLAALTWRFVERPIRHHRSGRTVPLLVIAFVLTGCSGLMVLLGYLPAKPVPSVLKRVLEARADAEPLAGMLRLVQYGNQAVYATGGPGPCTLVLGDSNAQQYAPRLVEVLKGPGSKGRGALLVAEGGVPPFSGITHTRQCLYMMPTFFQVLEEHPSVDRVLIAARWDQYFAPGNGYLYRGKPLSDPKVSAAALEDFGGMIRGLVESGKKVVVVLNMPTALSLDPANAISRDYFGRCSLRGDVLTKSDFLRADGGTRNRVAAVAVASGASLIDPLDTLTHEGVCLKENQDGPVYHDAAHLRPSFVRKEIRYLDPFLLP